MSVATDTATGRDGKPRDTAAITPIPIPGADQVAAGVGDPAPDEVGEWVGRISGDLSAALGTLLMSLGTRSGLWQALAGAGPLTSEQVAGRVRVDPVLVREWLRAEAAAGYLAYDADGDTFTLPDAVGLALLEAPGAALVEACVPMLCSMAEGFDEFADAFASGRGFGWHQRTAAHWHGADALTRLTIPTELLGAAIEQLPDVARALQAGGRVVDMGCGYGAPTIGIAGLYPNAQVLGVDYHDASIMQARRTAEACGVENIRFEVGTAADPATLHGVRYDLVTFVDSLHDLGDPRAALTVARAALAPAGVVLLVEPLSGETVAANLGPNGRMFYAISTLVCTPNAVSQRTPASPVPLGAQAGEAALRDVAIQAGFTSVRRLDVPLPLNLVLELRP